MRALKPQRRPVNRAEGKFFDMATSKGWELSKKGWPDFFCKKGDEIMLVEIKSKHTQHLSRHQEKIIRGLARYGVPCWFWTPVGGFEKIVGESK